MIWFLSPNGVILIYDDLPCDYFEIVNQFPYLGYNFASRTSGYSLPPEIRIGTWRKNITSREKYEEYLPPGKISEYLENDQFVEYRVPRNPPPKRRSTAWEFMGQEVPWRFMNLLDRLFPDRRVSVPSGSASAEVVGTEASTGSASAEVVEAELSTMNKLELQAAQTLLRSLGIFSNLE